MEKICINEYIRTVDGYIRKVIQVNEKGSYECLCWGAYLVDEKYKNSVGISAKKVKNHSFNIIDLIEEGDIVEFRINELSKIDISFVKLYRDVRSGKSYLGVDGFNIENVIILSIMTKEQFKNGKYGVGE